MATIIEAPKSNFVAHPEGTFVAVLRDTFLKERPNPWKGSANDKGVIDTRETITELIMEFLTDHEVEVGGKSMPGYVRFAATASLAENAKLRKFIQGWFPQLKDSDYSRFDADKLIGKGAYITVNNTVSKKGDIFANVIGAMQPPKGSVLPTIPSDFVRHQDKAPAQPASTDLNSPDSIAAGYSGDIGGDESIMPAGPQKGVPAPSYEDRPF